MEESTKPSTRSFVFCSKGIPTRVSMFNERVKFQGIDY